MDRAVLSDLCVSEIMNRWPSTIGVFIDLGMHCVGCPIGTFHTLVDAATEHAIPMATVLTEVEAAIAGNRARAAPEPHRPRSAAAGAGP